MDRIISFGLIFPYLDPPSPYHTQIHRTAFFLISLSIITSIVDCYVFDGLWTVPFLIFLSSFIAIYFPLSYADYIGLPRSFLLIRYHPNLRSTLVLFSGALLIPLSERWLLSCTIHRPTKRWYCRLRTMSPSLPYPYSLGLVLQYIRMYQ